jgi:PadR family transcriptional regulator, regulatory protein PadR
MREATFAILSALADGERHGYAIMSEVAAISGGTIQLQAGTLYAALDRLRVDGLVQVAGEEIVGGRLRRSFALTDKGRSRLADEARHRLDGAQIALKRLNTKTVGT